MKRILNIEERATMRIWMIMIQESRNFNAFNSVLARRSEASVIIRPRSVK